MRNASISRQTKETRIELVLDLDQPGSEGTIRTGSGFLDHMLDLFRKHGGFGLSVICEGDTHIDMHHSAEDIAICLGEALAQAVGDKKGIERYGFYYVTMDEALARCALDLSGRVSFVWNAPIPSSRVGNLDIELVSHFFSSVAENAKMNLHLDLLRGTNSHHCVEALFKAFARALSMAVSPSRRVMGVPSTKGSL
ncbi:MAG TPA: imidazoleglycerol-phosphate dehydratase HisB [Fibrobacteres bacterium]|jgi:imidazoleglycerol-phosphate dehydratase|nr:imidazoleglycerol-phosphate dehydratase HisB [Fibrobacterota bacterium]